MRSTCQVCVAESVSVVSFLTVRCAGPTLPLEIATRLEELKYLFRPGTESRARGSRRSESLNSVGLSGRPKAGVAPTRPGRREVHLKAGVAQWWADVRVSRPGGSHPSRCQASAERSRWTARVALRGACPPVIRIQPGRPSRG